MAFCYVEAAANLLTVEELDPFGKIPEFKFCAVRVVPAEQPALTPAVEVASAG
jgi:formate dehydrogenase major subunit